MSKKEKKPMDVNVKTTIIRCISAVLCVAILICGSVIISNKANDNKIKVAQNVSGGSVSSDNGTQDGSDSSVGTDTAADSGITGDETQKDASAEDGTADAAAADSGTSADAAPADSGSSSSSSSSKSSSGSSSSSSASKSTAEIISIYNAATKKAVDSKVMFTKNRTTTEKNYDAKGALNTKTIKDTVYGFIGIGTKSDAVDKNEYHKSLQASRLTASDVTSATIKESNGTSTITLALKNGSSKVQNGKVVSAVNNTALDKCGIAQGKEDKSYWDHKNAENIYAAIDEVPLCGSANIDESYSGATVTMVINANGQIQSMVVKFTFKVDLSKVMSSTGSAEAATTVTMNNFKW